MQQTNSLEKMRFLSGSWLKLIAVVLMFIDHATLILLKDVPSFHAPLLQLGNKALTVYEILRQIGRPAFPIFCFLVAEGYVHTGNRKKYGRNLLIFALLSEIPYNLMLGGQVLHPASQNVFVTLFLGFLFMEIWNRDWPELWKILAFLVVAALALAARSDYGIRGAVLVLLMYALRERKPLRMILAYPMLSGGAAAFMAFVPISLYNGQRGFIRGKWMKYAFYMFYPVHILLLWIVKQYL